MRERYIASLRCANAQVWQVFQGACARTLGAPHHINELVAFAILRDGHAVQPGLQGERHILRGDAQCARTALVDLDLEVLDFVIPVKMHITQAVILTHDVCYLMGGGAQLGEVFTHDAKLHHVTDGRAIFQTHHAATHASPAAIWGIEILFQALFDALARFDTLGAQQ